SREIDLPQGRAAVNEETPRRPQRPLDRSETCLLLLRVAAVEGADADGDCEVVGLFARHQRKTVGAGLPEGEIGWIIGCFGLRYGLCRTIDAEHEALRQAARQLARHGAGSAADLEDTLVRP